MSIVLDDLTDEIAARVRIEREERKWSFTDTAERSGVSKAMISRIERGESSPTTAVSPKIKSAPLSQSKALFASLHKSPPSPYNP